MSKGDYRWTRFKCNTPVCNFPHSKPGKCRGHVIETKEHATHVHVIIDDVKEIEIETGLFEALAKLSK